MTSPNDHTPTAEFDQTANLIAKHHPVFDKAGGLIGCQCRDEIGFPTGQTWDDHLAEQIALAPPPRFRHAEERRLAYVIHDAVCTAYKHEGRNAMCERAAQAVLNSDFLERVIEDVKRGVYEHAGLTLPPASSTPEEA